MDAESANIEPKRRTRLHQVGSNAEIENLRSDILQAENKIIEDIGKLKETFTPERLANFLVLSAREELLSRIKTIDWQKLGYASEKVGTKLKNYPYLSAFMGIGAGGLLLYALMKHGENAEQDFAAKETSGIKKLELSGTGSMDGGTTGAVADYSQEGMTEL